MKRYLQHKENGFTVIELMIVIVILAVTAVMVAPRIGGNTAAVRLTSAVDQIVSDINFARQTAVNCNTTVRINFSTTASGEPTYAILSNNVVQRTRLFSRNTYGPITIRPATGNVLIFNNSGQPRNASNTIPQNADITINGPDGASRVIRISVNTGLIQ